MGDSNHNINDIADQLKQAILSTMNPDVENSIRGQAYNLLEQVCY